MSDKTRVSRRLNVTWTTDAIWDDESLTAYHKAVYGALARHANREAESTPGMRTIAKKAGCSERKATQCIQDLAERGYIEIDQRFTEIDGKKVYTSNRYTLLDPTEPVEHEGVVHSMHQGSAHDAPGVVHEVQKKDFSSEGRILKEEGETSIEVTSGSDPDPSVPKETPDTNQPAQANQKASPGEFTEEDLLQEMTEYAIDHDFTLATSSGERKGLSKVVEERARETNTGEGDARRDVLHAFMAWLSGDGRHNPQKRLGYFLTAMKTRGPELFSEGYLFRPYEPIIREWSCPACARHHRSDLRADPKPTCSCGADIEMTEEVALEYATQRQDKIRSDKAMNDHLEAKLRAAGKWLTDEEVEAERMRFTEAATAEFWRRKKGAAA